MNQPLRRVLIQKVTDDPLHGRMSVEKSYEGWEQEPPAVGKPYRILVDSGRILQTSRVVKVLPEYLVTERSLYRLRILEKKAYRVDPADEHVTRELIFPREPSQSDGDDRLACLSPREREVFQLLAEGLSVKEAADRLFISHKTVEAHKYRIMEKLRIRSMNEWVKEAIRRGIVKI